MRVGGAQLEVTLTQPSGEGSVQRALGRKGLNHSDLRAGMAGYGAEGQEGHRRAIEEPLRAAGGDGSHAGKGKQGHHLTEGSLALEGARRGAGVG